MPICRYVICPVRDCMGLIIPEYEPDGRKLYLGHSEKWYLQCPVCHHNFVIPESELKTHEILLERIRQIYPDKR
jgi:hypothetical protein